MFEREIICPEHDCTGCMACFNACPVSAISVVSDSEGFDRPKINMDICTSCDMCRRVCPSLKPSELPGFFGKRVYAAWTANAVERRNSSSGGLFFELAKNIISKGGAVFGAGFDENFRVRHAFVEQENEISKLMGSKYVQSSIGNVFNEAKNFLAAGRHVLFAGTPCQIAGLRKFLRKDYANLTAIDFVCHGVPSPKVFEEYRLWLEKKFGGKLVKYSFRDKKWSWAHFNIFAEFSTRARYIGKWEEDPWMRGFLREYFIRPSCHGCRYANLNRQSDITLADFWGCPDTKFVRSGGFDRGISMVMLNTMKGVEMFGEISERLKYNEFPIETAVAGNRCLREPFPPSSVRADFWRDFHSGEPFEKLVSRYMFPDRIGLQTKILYSNKFVYAVFIRALKLRAKIRYRLNRLFSAA